jgi:hypothetical protein
MIEAPTTLCAHASSALPSPVTAVAIRLLAVPSSRHPRAFGSVAEPCRPGGISSVRPALGKLTAPLAPRAREAPVRVVPGPFRICLYRVRRRAARPGRPVRRVMRVSQIARAASAESRRGILSWMLKRQRPPKRLEALAGARTSLSNELGGPCRVDQARRRPEHPNNAPNRQSVPRRSSLDGRFFTPIRVRRCACGSGLRCACGSVT